MNDNCFAYKDVKMNGCREGWDDVLIDGWTNEKVIVDIKGWMKDI